MSAYTASASDCRAAAVERHHQQLPQPLPQRVRGGQRGELGDRVRVVAQLQVQVEPRLRQLEPPLLQSGALVLRVRPRYGGQRLAVPVGESLGHQLPRPRPVTGAPRLLGRAHRLLREMDVEGARTLVETYRVPAGLADQHVPAERLAEPGGVRTDRRQGLRR